MTVFIETDPSTADLLAFADPREAVRDLGAVLGARRVLETVGDGVRRLDATFRGDLTGSVAQAGARLLGELDLGTVLLVAWTRYRALVDAGHRTKGPDGGAEVVRLAEHTITSEHAPWVEVLVEGQQAYRVDFGVKLEFVIASLNAYVAHGRLTNLHAGDCTATITWSVRDFPIKQTKFARSIPLRVRLGDGIPLVRDA
ncbi:hypothetical protein JOL79_23575 [Microbispora sp. RL4-1S]|uniref:Uncharacterized protein n=1 Tax=Microbispora oryzae TaxID=2806554 RepID=A0A940WNT1_9ACTN|nr:hypothetical protein [Microbispora oryzae]MBP2706792.1 hypothetical protein [Microbispora oryzae]